jgi:exopolyphosphatase/guanosine-5'-triphosphate,3'-diphosphate pyrophosphatase
VEPSFLAAIDAGSNAVRFAAAEVRAGEPAQPIELQRVPLRLGTDAFAHGALGDETMEEAVSVLRSLRRRMDALGIVHYRAVGTSALRESANAPELAARAAREAGVRLEIISPEEEARLGWRAMRERVEVGTEPWLVADLGGGSLETTLFGPDGPLWSRSGPYGSVRLLREFPPDHLDRAALAERLAPMEEEVRAGLASAGPAAGLIAAGGSIDVLAELSGAEPDSRGARVVTLAALRETIARLAALSVAQRVEQLGLTPDRADVILHGALTYERMAVAAGVDRVHVPGAGVRDGVLLDLADAVAARRAEADPRRVVFLSDVHGNAPALRAAMEEAERLGAGMVVAAGDFVGDGPHPCAVVRMLRNNAASAIRGNVDRKVLRLAGKKRKKLLKRMEKARGARLNRVWTALQLRDGEEEREWLKSLPEEWRTEVAGADVLVVHGSPLSDNDRIFSSLTPRALASKLATVEGPRPDVLVCGHTHAPFAEVVDDVLVINCGSAGRPADGDPRGSLAVADLGESPPRAEIVRFDYPVEAVAADLTELEVPGLDADQFREGTKS